MTYKSCGLCSGARVPKALASDLDGCFTPYCTPSASREALYAWNGFRENIPSGFVTGKNLGYLEGVKKLNRVDSDFDAAENGGVILIRGEKIRYGNGGSVHTFRQMVYKDRKNGRLYPYVFEEPGKETIFTLFTDEGMLREIREYSEDKIRRMGLGLKVIPHRDAIDVVPVGLSKSYAIGIIAERLGIEPDYFLRIGDGKNDLEMLQEGIPASPGNAHYSIKETVEGRGGLVVPGEDGIGMLQIHDEFFGNGKRNKHIF